MKILHLNLYLLFFITSISFLTGCNAERATVGPAPPREQEIVRFRAANLNKQPVIFGHIEVLDKAGSYALSTAILSVDKSISFANEKGDYHLVLTPSVHQIMVGQIGIQQSHLKLDVQPGDSVRINFHLQPDLHSLE